MLKLKKAIKRKQRTEDDSNEHRNEVLMCIAKPETYFFVIFFFVAFDICKYEMSKPAFESVNRGGIS